MLFFRELAEVTLTDVDVTHASSNMILVKIWYTLSEFSATVSPLFQGKEAGLTDEDSETFNHKSVLTQIMNYRQTDRQTVVHIIYYIIYYTALLMAPNVSWGQN